MPSDGERADHLRWDTGPFTVHAEGNDYFGAKEKQTNSKSGRRAAQIRQLLPGTSQLATREDLLARGIERRETHGGKLTVSINWPWRLGRKR